MPYTTIVPSTAITSAWANSNVRDQVISYFADAAARNLAISAPTEGIMTYQADSNSFTVYSGSAWSTVGPVHGAWNTYTPTLTQSVAVTKTVSYASWTRNGRTISVNVLLTVTSTGTAANPILIGLPVSAAGSANVPIGTGSVYDSSTTIMYPGIAVWQSATTCGIFGAATGGGLLGQIGMSAALTNTPTADLVMLSLTYEAASDA